MRAARLLIERKNAPQNQTCRQSHHGHASTVCETDEVKAKKCKCRRGVGAGKARRPRQLIGSIVKQLDVRTVTAITLQITRTIDVSRELQPSDQQGHNGHAGHEIPQHPTMRTQSRRSPRQQESDDARYAEQTREVASPAMQQRIGPKRALAEPVARRHVNEKTRLMISPIATTNSAKGTTACHRPKRAENLTGSDPHVRRPRRP